MWIRMKKGEFYVDFCFEDPGDETGGNLSGRYGFGIEMTDEEYEELYQIWFEQDCELNNWSTEWDGHNKLFQKIDQAAIYALNRLLVDEDPVYQNPLDVWWQLSQETIKEF